MHNTCGLTADQALEKLFEGNREFSEKHFRSGIPAGEIELLDTQGQHPFATVITCSDSRVPPEIIFNCGLGEIFVIRTAGNVLGDFELGSVEYAAEHLGTPLIVVMGHSHCGAVASAVAEHGCEGHLGHILQEIEPAVLQAASITGDTDSLVSLAENLNVLHCVDVLKKDPVLQACPGLKIVGAKYNTGTGGVAFFQDQN